jgi:hypothetical protein
MKSVTEASSKLPEGDRRGRQGHWRFIKSQEVDQLVCRLPFRSKVDDS